LCTDNELDRSHEAQITNTVFFEDVNDITIYVEDRDKEAEYETIFKRLFQEKYRISKIFPAGSKTAVKECFYSERENKGKKQIFIVDGDFDRFKDESLINDPRFIYLEMYNIESYFIDHKAAAIFMKSLVCKMDEQVEQLLRFDTWYYKIVNQAKDLFLLYLYIQIYKSGVENVSRSPYLFLDRNTGFKREDGSFETYKAQILEDQENAEEKIDELRSKYESFYGNDYKYLICGKFLLKSLACHIKANCHKRKTHFDNDSLRWALINNFDVEKLSFIREKTLALYPIA